MRNSVSVICASALASALAIGEAQSTPISFVAMPASLIGNSDVIQVRDNVRWPRNGPGGGRHWGGGGRHWQGYRGHWNGNRGHWRGYRHGWGGGGWYGHYDNDWYGNGFYVGGGALLLGALIGSAIANSNYRSNYYAGNDHVRWCANRYRSYSPRTDTFQPYNGPRRRCVSPY